MSAPVERQASDASDSARISENFAVAKLLSILMVVTGHYYEQTVLWIPVTVGLFIFGFSSGYFTAGRYTGRVDWGAFWRGKFRRLFPPLLVVNLFLLALFMIEGREGVFSPHSLLAWAGLSGFLDWFGIHNQSPFGAGLWFFTVLLLFYLLYPLLNAACATSARAPGFIVGAALMCTAGDFLVSPPYMLWLTVFGFCLGVFAARISWRPRRPHSVAGLLACATCLLAFNVFGIKQFNFLLLVGLCLSTIAVLFTISLHRSRLGPLACLMPCVLEIYFIHTYLFLELPSLPRMFGFLGSLALVLPVAAGLYRFRIWAERLPGGRVLFNRR